jgi:hypothetical protein
MARSCRCLETGPGYPGPKSVLRYTILQRRKTGITTSLDGSPMAKLRTHPPAEIIPLSVYRAAFRKGAPMEKTEEQANEELRKGLESGACKNWTPDDFDALIKALASDHARPDETERSLGPWHFKLPSPVGGYGSRDPLRQYLRLGVGNVHEQLFASKTYRTRGTQNSAGPMGSAFSRRDDLPPVRPSGIWYVNCPAIHACASGS